MLTTLGAYEALHCAITGLVNPGDEVVIIEPHYDCYVPMTTACGGVPVFIPLIRHDIEGKTEWRLDVDELESKFNEKTKLIIINTPQNPLGKVSMFNLMKILVIYSLDLQVYSEEELRRISDLCVKYNVIVVSDEVYEWITYDNSKHFRIGEGLPHITQFSLQLPVLSLHSRYV